MQIIRTREALSAARPGLGRTGLVPTMGALHDGHLALVETARQACERVVASIFVNPTQFSSARDAGAYPRDEAADLEALERAGCDAVWLPTAETMYPPGDCTLIEPGGPALAWEGAERPGHFRGMATVVAKLFGLVRPDMAFFGEKDWQQLQVVRRMVADLLLPVAVVGVPTVRDPDGLALSSRNRLLGAGDRARAPAIHACLQRVRTELLGGRAIEATLTAGRARLAHAGFTVDYLALVDDATLEPTRDLRRGRLITTARLGSVRLLDNIAV